MLEQLISMVLRHVQVARLVVEHSVKSLNKFEKLNWNNGNGQHFVLTISYIKIYKM